MYYISHSQATQKVERWDFDLLRPFLFLFFLSPAATSLCLLATTATCCLESVEKKRPLTHHNVSNKSRHLVALFQPANNVSSFLDYYRFAKTSVTAASRNEAREGESGSEKERERRDS